MSALTNTVGFVRTVLGDIPSESLGVCYAHEHVIIDHGFTAQRFPQFLLNDIPKIVSELTRFRVDGGQAMIDSMPGGAGRNVLKLAEVSRLTGVHIVCPTGLHLAKYYPPGHWSEGISAEHLAEIFIAEIEQGISDEENSSARVPTPHHAGVVKIASGLNDISPRDQRVFEAASMTHRRTGAPILTHTEQGTSALEQIALLKKFGVNLNRVVLSHTDRNPEAAYHREILSTGVGLEYDSAFRWPAGGSNPTLELVLMLIGDFPTQIMLGMDAARPAYWGSYGGKPGLSFLLKDFTRQLRERGLTQKQWEQIFITNPARYFSSVDSPSNRKK